MKMEFMHIGAPVNQPAPNETYNAGMKVWIGDVDKHPFKMETLRFEPGSWLAQEIQTQTHVAVKVDSLTEALTMCEKILLEPVAIDDHLTIAFAVKDGVVMEFMEFKQ
jgi:hypothetical protein